MFQDRTPIMNTAALPVRQPRRDVMTVTQEEQNIIRVEEKLLHPPRWKTNPLTTFDSMAIREEICDILMGMFKEASIRDLAANAVHPESFIIAHYVKNLFSKGVLSIQDDRLFHMILDVQAAPGSPDPVQSRFWFSQAILADGYVTGRATNLNFKPAMSTPNIREILSIVEEFTDIQADRIRSAERDRKVSDARFRAIFVMRNVSILSLSQIGSCLGGRDHTTVLNGIEQIRKKIRQDASRKPIMMRLCNVADTIGANRGYEFIKAQH